MIDLVFYPESKFTDENRPLYYLEIRDGNRWQLFKRNCHKDFISFMNPHGEMHPWNLGEGVIHPPNVISMNSLDFLKFMVDSLNKNCDTP